MGPEQTRLLDRLFSDPTRTVRNFGFTVGDGNPTPEQLCGEINKAMDDVARRMAAGETWDGPPRTETPQRNVRDIVAELDAKTHSD